MGALIVLNLTVIVMLGFTLQKLNRIAAKIDKPQTDEKEIEAVIKKIDVIIQDVKNTIH